MSTNLQELGYDLKKLEKARYAFRFKSKDRIEMHRLNPKTKEETLLKDYWSGQWRSYSWWLDNSKSWVAVYIKWSRETKEKKLKFWIKETRDNDEVHHYAVFLDWQEEVCVTIGEEDEMIREGKNWIAKKDHDKQKTK